MSSKTDSHKMTLSNFKLRLVTTIFLGGILFGCNPNEDLNDTSSLLNHTIKVEAILDNPIQAVDTFAIGADQIPNHVEVFQLTAFGQSELTSYAPNHLGQTTLSQEFYGAGTISLRYEVLYQNELFFDSMGNYILGEFGCNGVTIHVYMDGELEYTKVIEDLGLGCADGQAYSDIVNIP